MMVIADFLTLMYCVTCLLYKCRNGCNLCAVRISVFTMYKGQQFLWAAAWSVHFFFRNAR